MRTGQELGHYTIEEMIGQGGMGEVYRARDNRLGRDVALKFLPEAFTQDDARLARFEREAQLLAQLHHPHIASIFGLEESDGVRALAMELVEGPTLGEHLEQGLPSVEDALTMARQIAEALEEAHGKGIIHRDLKPANIKLTGEGQIKVLDFGLAKAMDPNAGVLEVASDSTESPTMTVGGTMQGVILGSAPYMAPEQAKGLGVDERADIWGFGVVLFEMLSGKRLFAGDSVTETLAGVLKTEIRFEDLREDTPAAIRRLLRRCLHRKRKQRLHHIADARLVIEDVLSGSDDGEAEVAPPTAPSRASRFWPLAVVLVAAVAGLAGYLLQPGEQTDSEPMQLTLQLSPEQQLIGGANAIMAFSPDGNTLYFAGLQDGKRCMFRRSMTKREASCIEGTDGADTVFVSPDGQWIGFVADGKLMKVPVEGGRPFELGEARGAGGATWLTDDTLIYAPIYSDGLFHGSADGGQSERLTTPDRESGELGHWWAQALPGERKIVFTAFRTPVDQSRIGVLDLDDGSIRWVVEGGFFGRYVPTGHLLYAKGYRLFAVPFDPGTATTTGPAVAVLDDLSVSHTGGSASFAVSAKGTLAYMSRTSGNPLREVVWLDRDGNATLAFEDKTHFIMSVNLSPDDNQVALTIRDESRDLWVHDFRRGTLSRLTTSAQTEFDPAWSADGKDLFYIVDAPPFELYRMQAGRPDSGQRLFEEPPKFDSTSVNVSPDGRTVVYSMSEEGTGSNIYTRAVDGSEPARVFRASRSEEDYASFSPDGKWIVYESGETGRSELYAEPYPGPGNRVQLTSNGGKEPFWARNGEVFFRRDDEFFAIATRPGEDFEFDAPVSLFRAAIVTGNVDELRTFDVSRDGRRMLAVTIPKTRWPRRLEIVIDWTAQLDERAPQR